MKKKEVKKLQLSRETLLALESPEVQKAVRGRGGEFSSESYGCGPMSPTMGNSDGCCA